MNSKSLFLTAAIAGMMTASFAGAEEAKTKGEAKSAEAETVQCYGVNSCKGKSECHTSTTSCAGANSCKGKGWIQMSAKDCASKGGTTTEAKTEQKDAKKDTKTKS